MKVLLLGGTGLISTGIVKHLLARNAEVWMLNRGQRENTLPPGIRAISADRHTPGALAPAAAQNFDAVIDMCCFDPATCRTTLDAFAGRTRHYLFCSTVCTYGVKVPETVFIDESFPQEPISTYGQNKLACEKLVLEYHAAGKLAGTILRPSCTYGPGNPMIDPLEFDSVAWDRIAKGKPVILPDGGLGLWVATHRDDVGKAFAYAVLNEKTFGQSYNTTRDQHTTWQTYIEQCALPLGQKPQFLSMPAQWIVQHDPQRFGLLREITAFHGAYNSNKAKRDIPQFTCDVDLPTGAAQAFADVRRRNKWRNSDNDELYERMIKTAQILHTA